MSHLTARYGLIHGSYWMAYATVSGFVSLYLLDLGFSSGEIGILIAVAGLLSAVLQPLVASYADRPNSLSLKNINLLLAAAAGLCCSALLLVRENRVLTLILYGLALALLQLSTPLINSLAVTSIRCGYSVNLGIAKSLGSITYALASFFLGRICARFGGIMVPIAAAFFYGLFFLSLCQYPRQRIQQSPKKPQAASSGFFQKYPGFTGFLTGCALILISHVFMNSFILQIVESKGGGSSEMGTATAICALVEVPTMLLFTRMLKKKPSSFWMRFTGFFFILKSLGSLLCTTVLGFYFFQATQFLTWAIIAVASIYYINALMEPQDTVKGQAYYTMAYSLSFVVGGILGGQLIDRLGVNAMLLVGTISAALGTLVVCRFTVKVTDKI